VAQRHLPDDTFSCARTVDEPTRRATTRALVRHGLTRNANEIANPPVEPILSGFEYDRISDRRYQEMPPATPAGDFLAVTHDSPPDIPEKSRLVGIRIGFPPRV